MAITLLADSVRQAGPIAPAGIGVASIPHVVVTAVATASGRLRLISWRVSGDGRSIERLNDSGNQGDMADLVDICQAAFNFFVTASRLPNGRLRITAWKVTPQTGAIDRAGDDDDSEGAVSEIAMAESPTSNGRVQIAVKDGAGNLVLKNWEVDQFGKLHRRGDTAMQGGGAGKASNLAVRWGPGGLITAVRTAGGNLKLIVWKVQQDGSFKRLGEGSAGAVSVVSLTAIPGHGVVTAVRDGNNNLKLIAWRISDGGMTVTRGADSGAAAGGVDRIASVFYDLSGPTPEFPLDEGDPVLLTAVRAKRKLLKLIKWRLSENAIDRLDDFGENTGPIDQLAHRIVKPVTDIRIHLVAFRDGNDRLRLTTYQVDDDHQPTVLSDRLVLSGNYAFENTLCVAPPALPATVMGKIVLNLGFGASAGFVHRDLLGPDKKFAPSGAPTLVPYPLNTSVQGIGTDNQIIRLQDGSLLAIKNGYVWSNLTSPPAWFNSVTITVSGSMSSPQLRGVVHVFRSTNAGVSWNVHSVVDAALFAGGDYSWPQPKKKPPLGPTSVTGIWHPGGFDRTELYQDPWTKRLYIYAHADGGPFEKADGTTVDNSDAFILEWNNASQKWGILHKFKEGVHSPCVMSSTPNFPLVALTQTGGGGDPLLYTLKKGASKLAGPHFVNAKIEGEDIKVGVDSDNTDDVQPNTKGTTAIMRIGASDRVRLTYPVVNSEKRQVYPICNVTLALDGSVNVDHIATIEAQDPAKASCVLGAFALDDRIDAPNDAMMFSWIEVPMLAGGATTLLARYKVFFGTAGQYRSGVLSLAGGAPAPFPRGAIGDYRKSPGFHLQGKTHYLAQWTDSTGIYGNIVSLAP